MNATYLRQETNGERPWSVAVHTDLLLQAQMRERKRIAQELHDTLLQGFTGIGLKLQGLASSLPPSLAVLKAQVLRLLEESDQYLAEARRAIWELRSPLLQKSGDFFECACRGQPTSAGEHKYPAELFSRGYEEPS